MKRQAHRRGDPPVEAGTSAVNKSSKTFAKLLLLFPLSLILFHSPRLSLVARQKLLLKVVTGASIGGNLQLRSEGCLHLISGELATGKDFFKDAADPAKHLRHAAPVKCLTSKTCSAPLPPAPHAPLAQLQLLPASLRFLISSACQPFGRDKYI